MTSEDTRSRIGAAFEAWWDVHVDDGSTDRVFAGAAFTAGYETACADALLASEQFVVEAARESMASTALLGASLDVELIQ